MRKSAIDEGPRLSRPGCLCNLDWVRHRDLTSYHNVQLAKWATQIPNQAGSSGQESLSAYAQAAEDVAIRYADGHSRPAQQSIRWMSTSRRASSVRRLCT